MGRPKGGKKKDHNAGGSKPKEKKLAPGQMRQKKIPLDSSMATDVPQVPPGRVPPSITDKNEEDCLQEK
jgi:hypothetical protein